jgi:murein DD-endopeptidase MepM/ murein hydrolase activator NlpD
MMNSGKKRALVFLFAALIFAFQAAAQSAAQSVHLRYTVMPDNPRPGEPVTIGVSTNEKEARLFVDGRQLAAAKFFPVPAADGNEGFNAAVLTVPSTVRPGGAVINLYNEWNAVYEIAITIAPRNFVSEVIELNPTLTGIRTDPDPQKTAESDRLWGILTRTGNEIFHTGTFILPVTSTRRTSFFGDRRVYKYSNGKSDTSIHAGVDFGVPTGTQVLACGSGKVVLARNRIVTGNSVVIEHAPGVYSLYYHLDKIEVQEDAVINAGTLVGLSGSTGLSTGPHLHWEIRVSTENTDPDAFVARPLLDKDAILSKINN